MGTEVEHHLLLSLSENHGICQSRQTRPDLDRATTRIIHDTILESPSVRIPSPTSDRVVDQGSPEERPDQEGHESTTFGYRTCHNGSCNATELHLLSS